MEQEAGSTQPEQQQADEQAGFNAAFGVKPPEPTPAPTPAPEPTPEATPAAPAPTPAPAPVAEDETKAELRRLHGAFGQLNRELQALRAEKAQAGQPQTLTKPELKRLSAEFPQLAEVLQEDLPAVLASLGKSPDPKEIETLVEQRVQERVSQVQARLNEDAVTGAHENWKQDLWVGGELGKQRTPSYQAWLKTMSDEDAAKFEGSANPYFVIARLNQFYDWKAQAAKAEADKQQRLKTNVPAKGAGRAASSNLTDREALEKGFNAVFDS